MGEGDLPQASEKIWGAVAQMVKVVATTRGLKHSNHGALHEVVRALYVETEDEDFISLMRSANRLHVNFYENDLDVDGVSALVDDAKALVHKLRVSLGAVQEQQDENDNQR